MTSEQVRERQSQLIDRFNQVQVQNQLMEVLPYSRSGPSFDQLNNSGTNRAINNFGTNEEFPDFGSLIYPISSLERQGQPQQAVNQNRINTDPQRQIGANSLSFRTTRGLGTVGGNYITPLTYEQEV